MISMTVVVVVVAFDRFLLMEKIVKKAHYKNVIANPMRCSKRLPNKKRKDLCLTEAST